MSYMHNEDDDQISRGSHASATYNEVRDLRGGVIRKANIQNSESFNYSKGV